MDIRGRILAVAFSRRRDSGDMRKTLTVLVVSSAPFPFSICVYSTPFFGVPGAWSVMVGGQGQKVVVVFEAEINEVGVVLVLRGDGYIYSVHMLEAVPRPHDVVR